MTTLEGEGNITVLLRRWSDGDADALERLLPLVYRRLHQLAHGYLRRESSGHTLQTTALINEALVRLIDDPTVRWQCRSHFYGIAARIMRRILVDHARRRRTEKRGWGARWVSLDEARDLALDEPLGCEQLLTLDDALSRLEAMDERAGRVVELRVFGGLSTREGAEAMDLSPATIKREWSAARAWLNHELAHS